MIYKSIRGLLFVITIIFLAILAVLTVSETLRLSQDQLACFRLIALAMAAWGVFGRSGWEVQTIDGKTPSEKFNNFWFLFLYAIGLFLGALGILVKSVMIVG